MRLIASLILGPLLVAGCANTAVTQMAQNRVMISTSAAPACGRSGAARVASQMAAVATLRQGYDRFVILGASAESNVGAVSNPVYTVGGNVYGGGAMFYGTNDADLQVLMMRPGDPGYEQAVDARSQLGADWQKIVRKGIHSC